MGFRLKGTGPSFSARGVHGPNNRSPRNVPRAGREGAKVAKEQEFEETHQVAAKGSGWFGVAGGIAFQQVKEEAMAVMMRWEPFRGLRHKMRRLQREMDRFFGPRGGGVQTWPELALSYPAVNVWEDDDFVYAEAELPGLKLENLEITVTGDNQLTLKGKREPVAPEKVEWHRQERGFGSFERVLPLPIEVDASKVEARLENGVLTIKMAKSLAAKPRKIQVKAE